MADIVRPGAPAEGPLNAEAMPANFDLVIYKGDYVELFITVKDASGNAIDLTGSTPAAQLRSDYEDATAIDFICTLTGTTGRVRVFLPSSISASLETGDYIWDFQVTDAGDMTRTYLTGDVVVYDEVTKQ